MRSPPRVFISYARSDGEEFAGRLRQRIERELPDVPLWQDRANLEGGVGWWKQIAEALDVVETLVMVMTPAVVGSAVAQKEWRYARQQGVRLCPVLGGDAHWFDSAGLPGWMRKAHCQDLSKEWDTFAALLRSPHVASRVPFMAPDLRDDFVPRPAEHQQLVRMLLDESRSNPLAITTALQGAGGFGKTTLAAALCHDEDVITAFDDGILWATLGERPNVQQELTKLYAALTGNRPTFVDADDASIELAARLEDKNCLIVLDDVWDPNDVKPFLRGGHQCARLITTRRLQVVTGAGATRVLVDEMTEDESVAMLMARLPARPVDPAPFRRLAERLGEWPILLKLTASQIRERIERGDTVNGALAFVNRALDKRGAVAFDRANPSSRNDAVTTTVAASLALLSAADGTRATELSVLSGATRAPLSAASALWGLDSFDTEDLVQRLDDASLVDYDLKTGTFRMHDVLRSHLLAQLPDAPAVHRRLVRQGWPDPHALPDAFAWRWFGWHLVQAGDGQQLQDLLLDYRWLWAKLAATDVHALVHDFEIVDQAEPFLTIRDALRLSVYSIGRNPAQLGVQLADGSIGDSRRPGTACSTRSIARGPSTSPAAWRHADPSGRVSHRHPQGHHGLARGARGVAGRHDRRDRIRRLGGACLGLERMAHTASAAWSRGDGACRGVHTGRPPDHLGLRGPDLRVWDVESGECLSVWRGHYEPVRDVAVSPDGRSVVSLAEDGSVRAWDLVNPRSTVVFKGAFHQVRGIGYTPDGARILFGAGDGSIRALDAATYREQRTIGGQNAVVSALAIDGGGRRVLAGAYDGSLRLWDLASGHEVRAFSGHERSVGGVAFGPGDAWAASGGGDRTVRVWNVETGALMRSLDGHSGSVTSVAVLPAGSRIVTASADRTLRCWRMDGPQTRARIDAQAGAITRIAVSADGTRIVACTSSSTAQLWDRARPGAVHLLEGHTQPVQTIGLSADGTVALTASRDRTLRVWDLTTGLTRHVLAGHTDGVAAAVMTPDNRRAVSLSLDRTLRSWDLERGQALRVLAGRESGRSVEALRARTLLSEEATAPQIDTTDLLIARSARLAISSDGMRAIFGAGGTIGVWHLDTGRIVSTDVEDFEAEEVAVDGGAAIVGSILGTLCLIDPEHARPMAFLDPSRGYARNARILDIVVDAEAHRAIAATRDGRLRTWDLASGLETAVFDPGLGSVDVVAIAPNGRLAYSVMGDTVLVSTWWSARSGTACRSITASQRSRSPPTA